MSKKKKDKVTKGTSQAVLLSVLIHVGLFLLAGTLVIFTVVKQKEVEFEPPKAVERPKMKLKKPKVKIKQSSRPKSTTRIASKNAKAVMPSIELPAMDGMGDGLGDVVGMDLMPDFKLEESFFGAEQSIGNDLEGTFYDFNRKKNGGFYGATQSGVGDMVGKFLSSGWDKAVFNSVYRSGKKLYATSIPMHITVSDDAPDAFNEPNAEAYLWLVHYMGKIVYPKDITFRFWSYADDIVAVRLDNEIIHLNCYYRWHTHFQDNTIDLWQSRATENRQYPIGNSRAVVGDWVTLKAGEPMDIEILIGENYGGIFGALLLVEVKGQTYPSGAGQLPILPLFKTEEFTRDQIENIYWYLPADEGTCAGGPIFNDFHDPESVVTEEPPDVIYPPDKAETAATNALPDLSELRTWALSGGKEIEAKYKTMMAGKVLMENRRGKQQKIAFSEFNDQDKELISLANPPRFDLNFTKSSTQRTTRKVSMGDEPKRTRIWDFTFGFQARQNNNAPDYNYPLTIEYYAIGDEVEADNNILLDRRAVTFEPPAKGERRNYEFKSDQPVMLKQYLAMSGNWRGAQYGGYLIVVKDMHGNVIQHKASNEFLYEGFYNLGYVPVGRHFNRDCNRCMPPRPKKDDVPSWR